MIIGYRNLQIDQIETDICVVGAGPAGITLAREFIEQNIKVVLLESGGLEFDDQTQALAGGDTFGDSVIPPIEVCHRQFGGNSNVWNMKIREGKFGVRYAPFDEIDFEKRDWIPYSGWPFNRAHLEPYYERAQIVCQAGPFDYEADYWEDNQRQRLPLDNNVLETGMFQFGPADVFHTKYRQQLHTSPNIKIFSHANAVEITTNDSGKVANKIKVVCLNGKRFWISARFFILACGAFENARLLLMSNQQQSAGIGNQHDVVGRYYHDHPQIIGGQFFPTNPNLFNKTALYDLLDVKGTSVQGFLRLSRKTLEEKQLLNSNTILLPRPNRQQTEAINSFRYLSECLISNMYDLSGREKDKSLLRKKLNLFDNLPGNLLNMTMGLDYVAKAVYLKKMQNQSLLYTVGSGGWSELADNTGRFESFETFHLIEQSPDPENRVKLSPKLDALGCQMLELHWRWQRDDAENFARSLDVISQELLKAGLGKFHLELDRQQLPKIICPAGSHHLMGTTRMHNNPKQGVVDSDCRVHGVSNLFVAGSSTFPTGGHANPTLTIVAMSLRLADLIKTLIRQEQVELTNVDYITQS